MVRQLIRQPDGTVSDIRGRGAAGSAKGVMTSKRHKVMLFFAYALAVGEVMCATAIICIVSLTMVDWVGIDPATGSSTHHACLLGDVSDTWHSEAWLCKATFVWASVSIILAMAICFVECIPWNPCGLRTAIDFLLSTLGFVLWSIGSVGITHSKQKADDDNLPQATQRFTVWSLTLASAGLYFLEFMTKAAYICCRPRQSLAEAEDVELAVYQDEAGADHTARIMMKYTNWGVDALTGAGPGGGVDTGHTSGAVALGAAHGVADTDDTDQGGWRARGRGHGSRQGKRGRGRGRRDNGGL